MKQPVGAFAIALICAASLLSSCDKGSTPAGSNLATSVTDQTDSAGSSSGADSAGGGAADKKEPLPDFKKMSMDDNIKAGNKYLQDSNFDAAESAFLTALNQTERYTKQEARQAIILNNLSACYEGKEMYAQCIPLLTKAQKLFIRAYGRKYPAVYMTLGNLGRVLSKQNRWVEAAEVYQTAVRLMEDTGANNTEAYKEMLEADIKALRNAGQGLKASNAEEKLKNLKLPARAAAPQAEAAGGLGALKP